jgi:hypothetical protein
LESSEIDSDKQAAPFSPIEFFLLLKYFSNYFYLKKILFHKISIYLFNFKKLILLTINEFIDLFFFKIFTKLP